MANHSQKNAVVINVVQTSCWRQDQFLNFLTHKFMGVFHVHVKLGTPLKVDLKILRCEPKKLQGNCLNRRIATRSDLITSMED